MDTDREIREACEPHLQRLCGLVGIKSDPELIEAACDEIERLRSDLHEIKSEVVEYIHDGGDFNWTEAVIAIRHWREVAEAAEAEQES